MWDVEMGRGFWGSSMSRFSKGESTREEEDGESRDVRRDGGGVWGDVEWGGVGKFHFEGPLKMVDLDLLLQIPRASKAPC